MDLPMDKAVGNLSVRVKNWSGFIYFLDIPQYLHIENSNTDKSNSPTFHFIKYYMIIKLHHNITIYIYIYQMTH